MSQPPKVIDDVDKHYSELRDDLLSLANDLLVTAERHAADNDERREIIDLCVRHITQTMEAMTTNTKDAFSMINEIALEMKRQWNEMLEAKADAPNAREAPK